MPTPLEALDGDAAGELRSPCSTPTTASGSIDVGADARDPSRAGLLTPPSRSTPWSRRSTPPAGGTSRAATGAAASNLDLYQVNCTFYDALGQRRRALPDGADGAVLPARGPAGVLRRAARRARTTWSCSRATDVGRDVNRHHYTGEEVEAALRRPVVAALCALIRLRNEHPAFNGAFSCAPGQGRGGLSMRWDGEGCLRAAGGRHGRRDLPAQLERAGWPGRRGARSDERRGVGRARPLTVLLAVRGVVRGRPRSRRRGRRRRRSPAGRRCAPWRAASPSPRRWSAAGQSS